MRKNLVKMTWLSAKNPQRTEDFCIKIRQQTEDSCTDAADRFGAAASGKEASEDKSLFLSAC